MSNILDLSPKRVFYYFNEICQIPHPSKKEAKMTEWLMETGKALGLPTKRDAIGNVLISKSATPGKENVTPVIFQSHMDMVCEKNADTDFDFDKDAIQPWVDGEWLKAKGTTLGADDGIGMAIQLALLEDKSIEHGPIECLFTVDEETGLTGAEHLEAGFMNGKMLLNLDSEDEGEFFIGCAGGKDTQAFFDCEYVPVPKGYIAYNVIVKGLQGGHSGDDINKGRGNAVKLLNRILWNSYQYFDLFIASIDAGNLRNAIAREGKAHVIVPEAKKAEFESYLNEMDEIYKKEYAVTDPGVMVIFEAAPMPEKVWDEYLQVDVMNALYVCPHGVLAMSQDIENFVETSTNLASVKVKEGRIVISTSQRSSVESKKQDAVDMVSATFYSVGASEVINGDGYPGWTPNPNSEVMKVLDTAYQNLFHKKPAIKAIHAGLECGLFSLKYPNLDMVSYGPTLRGVHSPDEKLQIATVQQVWDLTVEFLKILK